MMQLNSLQPVNWFTRLETQLISHPEAPAPSTTQTANNSPSDPANPDPAAAVNPFAANFMAILIDAQAKHSAGADKTAGIAQDPGAGGSGSTAADAANALIQAFDTNGDGTISLSELEAGLKPDGSTTFTDAADARIARQFAKLAGSDGQISAADLTNAIQAREARIAARQADRQTQSADQTPTT
jgi:Ca2+-binding EF-hand superfamily protein